MTQPKLKTSETSTSTILSDEQIYERMVADAYDDQEKTKGQDEHVEIINDTKNSVEICDFMEYPFDRVYTITHPKKMTPKWLKDKILVTPSANKYNLRIDNIVKWIYKNLPKCFYCTLNYIVFLGNDLKADSAFLGRYNEFFARAIVEHDLPRGEQLGVNWFSDACVIISLGNIFVGTEDMLADGYIRKNERDECNNHGVAETIIHELRHLAQANPYIPEEIFKSRHPNPEEDAEIFAQEFCERHFVYAV